MGKRKRILCIGDNHLPYLKKRTFTRIIDEIIPSFKPHIIIDQGDKFDQLGQSKFPNKMIDPQSEILQAREMATEMWELIRKRAKSAKCFQLRGNHDARAYKRLTEKAPELIPFFDDKTPYEFPKVETIHNTKDELIIDNTLFTHGHRTKLAPHLQDVQYAHNVVIGHLHTAQQHYERVGALNGSIRWACCTGWIGDAFHEALNYRNLNKYFKWTQGCLLIEDGWPKFVGLE